MATLEETLYGLVPSETDQLWEQDLQQITEEEFQARKKPWDDEEARLKAEGYLPPAMKDQTKPAKLYTNVPEAGAAVEAEGKDVRYYGTNPQQEPTTYGKLRGGYVEGTSASPAETNKADFQLGIEKSLSELEAVKDDPIQYARQLAEISGEIAAKDAEFKRAAQQQSYSLHGVKALEAQVEILKRKEQLDPQHRSIFGNADGPAVSQAKQQLIAAIRAADGHVNDILSSNPDYVRTITEAQSLAKLVASHHERDIQKMDDMERRAVEELSGYTEKQRQTLAEITGTTDVRKQFSFLKARGQELGLVRQAISVPEKDQPFLALGGNPYSKELVLKKEAALQGEDAANMQFQKLEKIARDSKEAEKAFKEMKDSGFLKGEELKAWTEKFTAATLGLKGQKASKEEAAMFGIEIASKYAQFQAEKPFFQDILAVANKSPVPPPTWLVEMAKQPTLNGGSPAISLTKAAEFAAAGATPEERQVRKAELLQFYGAALGKQNNSILFRANNMLYDQLKTEIDKKIAVQSGWLKTAALSWEEALSAAVSGKRITAPINF